MLALKLHQSLAIFMGKSKQKNLTTYNFSFAMNVIIPIT